MPKKPAKSSRPLVYPDHDEVFRPEEAIVAEGPSVLQPSKLAYRDDARGIYLYHGDCLEVMDTLLAKHPNGIFDAIFADPPYFLSNGGITCQNGKMVKVDKGTWDKSQGPEINHQFNREWLQRCQRLLKPDGTMWVSGTHHVIFSIGYAMQQLGMKLLNQVTWQKPNPPPNLACRYFTHSTETVLWAAKHEKSRHRFNYADMRRANGNKQMKDVWTFTAPKNDEKRLGKHPTQKPIALLERILLASTQPGDLVLDPFMGSGTTGMGCLHWLRRFVGIEVSREYIDLSISRFVAAPGFIFFVRVFFDSKNGLESPQNRIDPILSMPREKTPNTDLVFHESKFVFLVCDQTGGGNVVHASTASSFENAWADAPQSKRVQATHVLRCETELRLLKSD